MIKVTATETVFRLAGVFTISRGSRTEARVVTVVVDDGAHSGIGECVPYARYGETVDGVIADIEGTAAKLGDDLSRDSLNAAMKPGAARNAFDCALWDLEAKKTGQRVWQLAGLSVPGAEITAYTLSLADPDTMRKKAAENAHRPLLKIKLGGDGDMERLKAVREGAPKTAIIVDANEGWDRAAYEELAPALIELGVKMVEQPFPAGEDEALRDIERVLPVCADESCHDRESLAGLVGKYDLINIKLDKTGGLTEALLMREEAIGLGFDIMVGCMVGSSLAMAPAVLVAQGAAYTDLDGPLLLAEDRNHPLTFDAAGIHPPASQLWG